MTLSVFFLGFDIKTEKGYEAMMSDFDHIVGLKYLKAIHLNDSKGEKQIQASTLTQNDTGPVGPVTPSICWSCKLFTGPTFFL